MTAAVPPEVSNVVDRSSVAVAVRSVAVVVKSRNAMNMRRSSEVDVSGRPHGR